MHFGGAVIDPERADFAEEACDDRVVGNAEAAEDLHAAIDDPPDCLGADDLRHARLVPTALALVEDPCGVPDDESALVDVHFIVGKHKPDTLVLPDRLPKRGAVPGVVCGDVMRAARGA